MPVAPALQNQTHRELMYRPLQFQKRSQQFIGVTIKSFPSPRCASATQIVRPRESMAEIQFKLQQLC
jgi:hypothetical protein